MTDAARTHPAAERHVKPQIVLNGLNLIPDVSGAMWIPGQATLLAADLHFEKGSAFARRGVHLPPYDTRSTLRALQAVCAKYKPARIISLGDSFHDDNAKDRMDPKDIDQIRQLTGDVEFIWVTGNHDTCPPMDLGGKIVESVEIDGVTLRHEPQDRLEISAEIAGHLHPVASVVMRGRRLRRRCFVTSENRIIMPAFGAYTGGLNVRNQAFDNLFPTGMFQAWLLGRDAVYKLPARRLLPERH